MPPVRTCSTGFDRLRPSLLRRPRHSELQKRLDAEGWDSESREVLQLMNENIHEDQEVFGEEIMESLRRSPSVLLRDCRGHERGAHKRSGAVLGRVGRALEKVTDLALLNDMQQWRLASELPPEDVSERAVRLAKEARSHRGAGELGAARDRPATPRRGTFCGDGASR